MKNILLIMLIFCGPVALCQQRVVKNDTLYQSVSLEKNDSTFLALKDTAQRHLPEFIKAVKAFGHDVKNYQLVVKSDFVENGTHEHMWSQVYEYSNGIFKSTLLIPLSTLEI